MVRVIVSVAIIINVSIAQPPRFEVASIHPADPKEFNGPSGCFTTPGLMRCSNVTLKRCITGAYRVGPDRVVGGPAWIDTDRFQISARSDLPLGDQGLMAMLQTLLADRFKLVLHRETRRGEGMVLKVAKRGPKLQPAGTERASWQNMQDHMDATKITMAEFAEILSRDLNIPVVDETGLSGTYNFALRWNPDNTEGRTHEESAAALRPEMSRAIARQLGLALTTRKMPVE